jgi:hypothetical protein
LSQQLVLAQGREEALANIAVSSQEHQEVQESKWTGKWKSEEEEEKEEG